MFLDVEICENLVPANQLKPVYEHIEAQNKHRATPRLFSTAILIKIPIFPLFDSSSISNPWLARVIFGIDPKKKRKE